MNTELQNTQVKPRVTEQASPASNSSANKFGNKSSNKEVKGEDSTPRKGRIQRQEDIELIKSRLQDADAFLFSDYRGLSVKQIGEVRKKLTTFSSSMHVHKNKLFKRALQELGYSDALQHFLTGPTAHVFIRGEASPVIKTLIDFEKKEKYSISVKGSYIEGQVYDQDQTEALSKIPSREQLLANLMGAMNAPAQKLASGLQDTIAKLARSLKALEETL